jgi:hypothetical protein
VVDVVVVRPEDYAEITAFMAGFPGMKPRTIGSWHNRLSAWWDLNPAFDEAFPRGWVLRDGGRITGFFGSIPLKLQLGGKEAIAFAATSWRVLPEHRGRSISLKMRQLATHKEHLHFSTTPKPELVALLTRLGYQQIRRGAGTESQSQIILDWQRFLRVRYPKLPLVTVSAPLAASMLAAVQALRTRSLGRSRYQVKDLDRADETFDALWERTRTRYANTNIRTAEMLNWYCFAMQAADKRLLASYDGDRLLGYMVLLVREQPHYRLLECIDVWLDPAADETGVLGSLVAKAAAVARTGAFERVLLPHFSAEIAALYVRLGLLQGPAWSKREYIKGPRHITDAITADNSYFVRAQGDYGL